MILLRILVLLTVSFYATALRLDSNYFKLQDYFITSTKIASKNNVTKRHADCSLLEINLDNTRYKLCVTIGYELGSTLVSPTTPIFIYNQNSQNITTLMNLNVEFVKGYVDGFANSSSIDGYIANGTFYGRIIIEKQSYYVENIQNFPELLTNASANPGILEESVVYKGLIEEWMHFIQIDNLIYNKIGNICSMILIIDDSFVKYVGMHDDKTSITIALHSMYRAHTVYRSTDFNDDGVPDNIGFRIKYVILMKGEANPFVVPYTKKPQNSKRFINLLSLLPNLRDACVGVMFTAQEFTNNIIGLSYTALSSAVMQSGGICMVGFGQSFNLIVISYYQKDHILPQVICDISVTHELGHSFGSVHDDKTCEGYLMAEKATNILTKSTFAFSPCSKKTINVVLNGRRKWCFEYDGSDFCGNGILENNEECDCGSYFDCIYSDKCCLAFNHKQGCQVNRLAGYSCHPSQGLCCTSKCQFKDISHLGLSCKNFQDQCTLNDQNKCGVDGICFQNHCHSKECARLGLAECLCIKNLPKSACSTCCLLNGRCMSAQDATGIKLKNDPNYITTLQKHVSIDSFQKTKLDVVRLFCAKNLCVRVGFKVFAKDGYCLFNGKLGTCNEHYICIIKTQKYSRLPIMMSDKSTGYKMQTNTFILINLYLIVFG